MDKNALKMAAIFTGFTGYFIQLSFFLIAYLNPDKRVYLSMDHWGVHLEFIGLIAITPFVLYGLVLLVKDYWNPKPKIVYLYRSGTNKDYSSD